MPDPDALKDLTWTVQTTVDAPDFESLTARARQRRRRHRALAVSVTATAAVAATTLALNGLPYPDRGTDPAASPAPAPTTDAPPVPRTADQILAAADARIEHAAMTPDGGVISTWVSCRPLDCQQAVVTRDGSGRVVTGPAVQTFLASGNDDERSILVDTDDLWTSGANAYTGDRRQPAVLVTASGRSAIQLATLSDTSTVASGDLIVSNPDEGGPLLVDVGRRTLRRLAIGGAYQYRFGRAYRDSTGAVWITAAPGPGRFDLVRSRDGKNWDRVESFTGDVLTSAAAVSPDGRTVAIAVDRASEQPGSSIRISYDAGATWSTVPGQHEHDGMAAFDDGSVLIDTDDTVQRITNDLTPRPVGTAPRMDRIEMAGGDLLGYDKTALRRSADQGTTWSVVRTR